MKRPRLHQTNNVFGVIVVLLAAFLLAAPFLPQLSFWWKKSVVKSAPPLVAAENNNTKPEVIPEQNTLVIPKIQMQQTIHENKNPQWGLAKGVWRDSAGSTPDKGSNTVLSGHRFTYGGPAVFYHLDKIAVGDDIVIYWNKQRQHFRVASVKVVPPTDTSVVKPTEEDLLTIYTCTPVVTAKNRLIIQAKRIEGR